jgi:chromosome partitioning protein
MKIVTIASQKGGVGKTTTALNLGFSLSRLGKKVLIVDGDPQGGIAQISNLDVRTSKGLVHALRNDKDDIVVFYQENSLAIVGTGINDPGDVLLFEKAAVDGTLGDLIRKISEGFDYVLIDAPVGIGQIVTALLGVSDSYILVMNCLASTVKSVSRFLEISQWIKENVNSELELTGVIVTMFHKNSLSETKIYKHLKTKLPDRFFFNTIIPFDDIFESASMRGIPAAMLQDSQVAASRYQKLGEEVIAMDPRRADERVSDEQAGIVEPGMAQEDSFVFEPPTPSLDEDSPAEPGLHSDLYEDILGSMCSKGNSYGAVVADKMGLPLASYQSPLSVDSLAAYTTVLGDSLDKASVILDQPNANNISLDINDTDKFVMRKFQVFDNTYYLLVVCPQVSDVLGEMELAVSRIVSGLSL